MHATREATRLTPTTAGRNGGPARPQLKKADTDRLRRKAIGSQRRPLPFEEFITPVDCPATTEPENEDDGIGFRSRLVA